MLSVATFLLAVSGLAVALTITTYSGWDSRSQDRSVRLAEIYREEEPQLLWQTAKAADSDGLQVAVVFISPLNASAPLPPGLWQWPEPGQAVVSPAMSAPNLMEVASRYGSVVGTIEPEGLMDPGERLVYARLADGVLSTQQGAWEGTGFGTSSFMQFGAMADRHSISTFAGLVALLMVLPALFTMMTAVRVGGGNRARRARILVLVGASRSQVRAMQWGEARAAWAWGLGAAAVLAVAFCLADVQLPWIGNVVQSRDTRTGWWVLLLALIVAGTVAALIATSRLALRPEGADPSSASATRRLAGWASPLAAVATIVGSNGLIGLSLLELVTPYFLLGSAVTVGLLPMTVSRWIAVLFGAARRTAARSGSPAVLVGSAQVAARPRPAARFAATAVAGIVLITLTYDMTDMISEEATRAIANRQALDNMVASISPWPWDSLATRTEVTGRLGEDYAIVGLRSREADATVLIQGSPASLERLGLGGVTETKMDGPAPAWIGPIIGTDTEVMPGELKVAGAERFVIAPWQENKVNVEALESQLGQYAKPAWSIDKIGESWVVGSVLAQIQNRWLEFFGVIGVAILLVGLWTGYSNELIRATRSVAPIQVLAPRLAFARSVLAWRIVAPVAMAIVPAFALGVALTLVLESSRLGGGLATLPYEFMAATSGVVVLSGLIAWIAASSSAVANIRRFRIGNPDE